MVTKLQTHMSQRPQNKGAKHLKQAYKNKNYIAIVKNLYLLLSFDLYLW